MADYSLTLSFNHEAEAIEFPVLPEKIEVSSSGNNKTYDISQLGEINVIKPGKLAEIAFESFFPASWFPGCNVEQRELFQPSHYIVDRIQDWRGKKHPVHLVLTGGPMNINMDVSIERFIWSESGGAVGDIAYQIALKEYRFYAARKVQVATQSGSASVAMPKLLSPAPAARPDTRVQPKTYTLVAGDNLWKVAQKFLGDGSKYKQIQSLNGIKDAELKRLPIGKVIKLP
ncbi:LysM peptidoglycan-binding domain-containing protein [Paenibacillus apis]|uniref:Peptidoglycan-binding protein LysM n=1 Tax=Paenibacillus apis TaxID=1792174 RepID=A0A919Y0M8_9BACL|nr:LysM peptidoglycan-binding domain-containing protein [Paenibacillus apis]GIO42467.1 peptidoglycan-binding protein LysM [Paenibacillus apis]